MFHKKDVPRTTHAASLSTIWKPWMAVLALTMVVTACRVSSLSTHVRRIYQVNRIVVLEDTIF